MPTTSTPASHRGRRAPDRTTITELAALLDPARFQQIHRSTIVNLDHLAGTRRDELSRLFVRVRGRGEELPVSRAYVHLFKAM
jgi:DNA-binding LytR/AlgR family response regulator